MDERTRDLLLGLNRRFYAAVAEPFHRTRLARSRGMEQLLAYVGPRLRRPGVLRVADIGCGNGRFALLLDGLGAQVGAEVDYTGVDGDAALLSHAAALTAELAHVAPRWLAADLADPAWAEPLGGGYHLVACLATLQHLPGYPLRLETVRRLRSLLAPGGVLALSAWQFLSSARLAARQLAWSTVGVDPAAVEAGDALLPWSQGVSAVRYVHQIDEPELRRLARDAGLAVLHTFRADGKEGDLNLYALLAAPDGSL